MFIRSILHVPFAAKRLKPAAVFLVLRPAGTLRDIREFPGLEFFDNFFDVPGIGLHRARAGIATSER